MKHLLWNERREKKSIKVDPNFEYFGKAEEEEEETEVPESPADDAVYNIEALIAKKGSTYLVKWENYADDQNTWEPSYSIPDPIVEYYEEDSSRLGRPLPTDFAKFEDAVEEKEDEDMWEPGEKKKDNKQHLKYTPQRKSSQLNVGEKTAKQKMKNKKLSLEVEQPKSKDPKEKVVERL